MHEATVKEYTLRRCDTVENIYEVVIVCGVTLRKVLLLIENLLGGVYST